MNLKARHSIKNGMFGSVLDRTYTLYQNFLDQRTTKTLYKRRQLRRQTRHMLSALDNCLVEISYNRKIKQKRKK